MPRLEPGFKASVEKLVSDFAQASRLSDHRWDEAVDWLLNSRHTADPDIQAPFWAYADGLITREELDTFSAGDVARREAELAAREDAGVDTNER